MKPYQQQNYYQLLEVPITATIEEIRSAYARSLQLHDPASAAMYALADPSQIEDLRKMLVEAMETLTSVELRADYDRSLGFAPASTAHSGPTQLGMTEILRSASTQPHLHRPIAPHPTADDQQVEAAAAHPIETPDAVPSSPEEPAAPGPEPAAVSPIGRPDAVPSPPEEPAAPGPDAGAAQPSPLAHQIRAKPKEFSPDAEFNGELLREVRESRGLTLQQVGERTRISVRHLENVEADRYEGLPAAVYLRGIVMNLARELKLDPIRVARSYLSLVASAKEKHK
jgi:curved DNA-binding protein CbpA